MSYKNFTLVSKILDNCLSFIDDIEGKLYAFLKNIYKRMVFTMKTSTNRITAFFVSLLITVGTGLCCFKIPVLSQTISSKGNINLLTYAIMVVLFCISYLLISLLLNRTDKPGILDAPGKAFSAALILFAGNILFLILMFYQEDRKSVV